MRDTILRGLRVELVDTELAKLAGIAIARGARGDSDRRVGDGFRGASG
jgi:hypothetical protein